MSDEELKEFAKKISGEYRDFDNPVDSCLYEKEAKDKGIIIVYGVSDDLCEFRGAIYDEADCWGGGIIYITSAGKISRTEETISYICANFADNSGWLWSYDTNIPHEDFELYDNGKKYCRGVVFYMADIAVDSYYVDIKQRIKVAERALQIAEELGELCAPAQNYIDIAKKELAKRK